MSVISKFYPDIPSPVAPASTYRLAAFWAFVLVVLELLRIVGFVLVDIDHIVLLGMMLVPVMWSMFSSEIRVDKLYMAFFIYLVINLLITKPLPLFRSWERLGLFVGLLVCMAPVIENKNSRFFRFYCFKYFMMLAVLLALVSLACYFMGVNYTRNAYNSDISVAGTFGGLFWTSMVLGPISAIATCFSFWCFMVTKRKLWLIVAILCMGANLFSASRSSVFGCVVGCAAIIYFGNKRRAKSLKQLFIVAILACLSFPLWEDATSGISQKNESNEVLGQYGTRTQKFEARMSEFDSSPIFGVGFASVNPKGKDIYNKYTGVVEPGSSWLGVASMTGIIGLLFMIAIYIKAFRSAVRSQSPYGNLLVGLIFYSAFHQLFEGYVLAAGSVLCLIFWLTIGVATDLRFCNLKYSNA